jgi:ribonucleoside-triphosphate reductase
MQMMGLAPSSDAGRFGYHLRELKNSNLIKGDESGYNLTELGQKVIEFVWSLIDYSRSEIIKEIPVRTSGYAIEHFDRNKISESLTREAKVPVDLAEEIAKEAEEQLMTAKVKYLTAPLIREVVNSILVLKGYEQYRHNLTRLGLPPYEVMRLVKDPKMHPLNSNPETIQKLLGDAIFEQYLLLNILSRETADAHLSGDVYIPNANYFIIRLNSIQHDLRPFLSDGLSLHKDSLAVFLNPPKNFAEALLLTAKILEFSQVHTSGMQSIDFFNVFLAPYIKNLSRNQIKEACLLFFKELGSTYIGPGGDLPQTTLNLEFEIPKYLVNTPIAGDTKGIYGDYLEEARLFLDIILDILMEGDSSGKPFFYPNQIFKLRKNSLTDPEVGPLFTKLQEVILKWGTPILANLSPEWQKSNVNYTGQFDRLDTSWKEDIELDTLRTGNLDTIYLNLPRIAYKSKQNDEKFFESLKEKASMAISTLIIKRTQLYSCIFEEGETYFRLEHATNALGYIGLPEAVEFHTNSKISTKSGLKFAAEIIKTLQELINKNIETTGFRWVLRQCPSENWIERLIQLDNKIITKDKDIKLKKPIEFYNISNVNSDLPFSLPERINLEANFQKFLTGGHIMVIPLVEATNSLESLIQITKKICNESIGLFTFAHDLTYCFHCKQTTKGNLKRCPTCNSAQNINYFNKNLNSYRLFNNLSKSERFEIRNRYKFSI